jgi:hypothetical protein
MAPPGLLRTMMSWNWAGVVRRDWAVIVAFRPMPGRLGTPPSWPAETWAFWARMAAMTSAGVRL